MLCVQNRSSSGNFLRQWLRARMQIVLPDKGEERLVHSLWKERQWYHWKRQILPQMCRKWAKALLLLRMPHQVNSSHKLCAIIWWFYSSVSGKFFHVLISVVNWSQVMWPPPRKSRHLWPTFFCHNSMLYDIFTFVMHGDRCPFFNALARDKWI